MKKIFTEIIVMYNLRGQPNIAALYVGFTFYELIVSTKTNFYVFLYYYINIIYPQHIEGFFKILQHCSIAAR